MINEQSWENVQDTSVSLTQIIQCMPEWCALQRSYVGTRVSADSHDWNRISPILLGPSVAVITVKSTGGCLQILLCGKRCAAIQ